MSDPLLADLFRIAQALRAIREGETPEVVVEALVDLARGLLHEYLALSPDQRANALGLLRTGASLPGAVRGAGAA